MLRIADRAGKALERELDKITLADVLREVGGPGENFTTEAQRIRS
jgi:DNA-binding IscR family transcriptional regulator